MEDPPSSRDHRPSGVPEKAVRKPRCGKKLLAYRLDRPRPYDYGEIPVCGLPEGHERYRKGCKSEEAVKREAGKKKEKDRTRVRRRR
jgi:hypothetical protein